MSRQSSVLLFLPILLMGCALGDRTSRSSGYLGGPMGVVPITLDRGSSQQYVSETPEPINAQDRPGADINDEEGNAVPSTAIPHPYREYANQPGVYKQLKTAGSSQKK